MATVVDISARKRAEDSQRVLVRELQHRTQNMFSVVHSIVSTTLFPAVTSVQAKADFTGRLKALAESYELIGETDWQCAPLAELLRRQLAPFAGHVGIRGCEVRMPVAMAQQLGMIVHELITNASSTAPSRTTPAASMWPATSTGTPSRSPGRSTVDRQSRPRPARASATSCCRASPASSRTRSR
ncbi:MAG: sensor histidine kinase [Alphaproteobacteria bacterium]|nr:sensor histidine kinase [Alphaproteobacteria bacterium]